MSGKTYTETIQPKHGSEHRKVALVNEAFLRLTGEHHPPWENRAHFFAVADDSNWSLSLC